MFWFGAFFTLFLIVGGFVAYKLGFVDKLMEKLFPKK